MKKINIVKKNEDYNRIIKSNKPFKYKDYIIYIERNTNDIYHFGFSIGKKIGNAVTRNKIKRQLKSIIDKNTYQNGFNCIIIVGRGILRKSFQEKECELNEALNKLKIKENKDEKKEKTINHNFASSYVITSNRMYQISQRQ